MLADDLKSYEVDVLGPVPQYISKIKDEYRWIITVRGKSSGRARIMLSLKYIWQEDMSLKIGESILIQELYKI